MNEQMGQREEDAAPVVVRRIVVPTEDVVRLAMQWFVAMLVIALLLWLLKLLVVAATGQTLIELVF